LFKKSFVEKTGLVWQDLRNSNDVFFVNTAIGLAERISTIGIPLVTYRVGHGTNLQANKSSHPIEFVKAYKAVKDELIKRGVYKNVEHSFKVQLISGIVYNIRTVNSAEAEKRIWNALFEDDKDHFELTKYTPIKSFEKYTYNQFKILLDKSRK
jgi:glycosyltransferase EpsH